MSWRLSIGHRSGFGYAGQAGSSFNEARMTPQTEPRQTTLEARVEVTPPAHTYRYWDYWGTQVTAFDLHAPHRRLSVLARSVVETQPVPPGVESVSWDAMVEPATADRWCEYVLPTYRTALDGELADRAAAFRAESPTPRVAGHAICEWVREEVAYVPGATGVQTDALQAWRQRQGVCQDISHLVVGLLRQMGMPARYVSGYFHPVAGAGSWTAFDPTNGLPVGERYVVVGRGRDYGDVPPLKGLYAGPESTEQAVEVTVTRLG